MQDGLAAMRGLAFGVPAMLALVGTATGGGPDSGGAVPLAASRGGPVVAEHLSSFVGYTIPELRKDLTPEERTEILRKRAEMEERSLAVLRQYIPPLSHARGDRWPILVWAHAGDTPEQWQAWIDRGISPLFQDVSSPAQTERALPRLRYFRDRSVPLIILPQGWVQRAHRQPPAGTGCDHLPPARPSHATIDEMEPNRDFTCPSWVYSNPALEVHAENAKRVCELLKRHGTKPASIWLDAESGVYLRNGAENEDRLRAALAEARKCSRCVERFGIEGLQDLRQYSDIADAALGYAYRVGFVDPVRSVFPGLPVGNFYAHPVRREPAVPGKHPAYGWSGSGFNVAQPRCYYIPGWRGAGRSQEMMDWNVFLYCIGRFSSCARVLEPGEILVPWVCYIWSNRNAPRQAKRGLKIASAHGYREMAIHTLLRGAETIAIFSPRPPGEMLPEDFNTMERAAMGGFALNVLDVQRGYDEVLAFNDHLRRGKVLNYDIDGEYRRLDERTAVWSGVGTETKALVRTVTFGPELTKTIRVWDRDVELTFRRRGRFFWITRDGTVTAVD